MSAARVSRQLLWLRELAPERIRFVGYITPQRAERRIQAAVTDLVWWLRSTGTEALVVDTDGWVQGVQSLEYKLEAAYTAGLDTVIVVGDRKLYSMLRSSWGRRGCGVHYLESPAARRTRDRSDRRLLRSEAYRRFLEPLRKRVLGFEEVTVLGSCFFLGDRLPAETAEGFSSVLRVPVLAASETYDTLYVVTRGQPDPVGVEKLSTALNKQVYILDANNMRGALLGIIGADGYEAGIGLLDSIDFRRNVFTVLTPYEGAITGIIIGGTRLNQNLEEQGRPLRCVV